MGPTGPRRFGSGRIGSGRIGDFQAANKTSGVADRAAVRRYPNHDLDLGVALMKLYLTVLFAAAASLVGSVQIAIASPLYTLTDIGSLGGGITMPSAINDSGQIVGSSFSSATADQAFLYSGGVMTNLGTYFPGV